MTAAAAQPRLEVADILRAYGDAYRASHPVSPEQAMVLRRLVACRTAALGGHVDSCDACGWVHVSYNSCRDRHCPKCQTTRQVAWLEARLARLLPVAYFHVVFTLPEQLQPLALKNRRVVYDLLFRAASQTLLELAADPRRLGAQIGFTAVLSPCTTLLLTILCLVFDVKDFGEADLGIPRPFRSTASGRNGLLNSASGLTGSENQRTFRERN